MLKIKNKILSAQIDIPDKLIPLMDKRTGAKSIFFPFMFPDGMAGHLILVKGVKMGWNPSDDINDVKITFK